MMGVFTPRKAGGLEHWSDMLEFVEGPKIISIFAFCCQVVANTGAIEDCGFLRRQLPHGKL